MVNVFIFRQALSRIHAMENHEWVRLRWFASSTPGNSRRSNDTANNSTSSLTLPEAGVSKLVSIACFPISPVS